MSESHTPVCVNPDSNPKEFPQPPEPCPSHCKGVHHPLLEPLRGDRHVQWHSAYIEPQHYRAPAPVHIYGPCRFRLRDRLKLLVRGSL
jgi:hypothetical protein